MDSCSQMSMYSDDSVPRNVYEEIVVDSTNDPKEDDIADTASTPTIPKTVDAASESDEESEEDESESASSVSTAPTPPTKDSDVPAPSDVIEKNKTNSSDEQKTANLKLVLKKSPEYQLVNPSSTQGKNSSNNKIFLVTLVSNANTSPTYSTAKYSVAANDVKAAANVSVASSKCVETNESLPVRENRDDDESDVLTANKDQIKPVKIHNRPSTATAVTDTDEQETDTGSVADADESIKDISDTDLSKLEGSESKYSSTPKLPRELQQLHKTVNESKILTEYMNESMGKSRKTRKFIPLKSSDNEGLSPVSQPMRSRSRSCSKPRNYSPTDEKLQRWPSEEKISKRQNMRSQNSEFVQKQMKFLNSIQQSGGDEASENSDCETSITDGKSSSHSMTETQQVINKRELHAAPKDGWDMFCFKCHCGMDLMPCSRCVRSFHPKCVKSASPSKTSNWVCPECVAVENSSKSLRTRANFSVDNLNQLLQFALNRMKQLKGSEHFLHEFNEEEYADFSKYIVHPVTLESLNANIEKKTYKCTEEFAVETKWILHNCSVYFGNNTKITNYAKGVLKVCRQEVTEIDTCPECYYAANTRKDWFVEVCSKPHILLWAKLKGFPYWPAKSMGMNGALVNVRFFGDHDRAYVPIKECFLYSENDPNPPIKQKKSIKECIKEVDVHIRKITAKFGSFVFPPFRTLYDPSKELQQLEIMIPGITESMKIAEKLSKPALTYKIVKTADNHLSIIKKDKEQNEDTSIACPTPVNITTDTTTSSKEPDKLQKQRIQSTDSSQSNNEVTSTCEPINEKSVNNEPSEEDKVVEKTVAPVKIQERVDIQSTTKTYEIVPKPNDDHEQTKVNSVILKRKLDNWNAVTAALKKPKVVPEASEVGSPGSKESNTPTTENAPQFPSNSHGTYNQMIPSVAIKRKRSREEVVTKYPKPKLDSDKIPPLAPLTPPFAIAQANSTLLAHATTIPTVAPLTIATGTSSGVTVTITQSPIVSSALSYETKSNKSSSNVVNSILSFGNSEISIKRVPKKQQPLAHLTVPQQATVSPQVSSKTSNANNDKSTIESLAVPPNKQQDTIIKKTQPTKLNEQSKSSESQEQNSVRKEPKRTCELIPFDEIKIEKPDSIETNSELVVEVRSKTTTPEQPTSTNKTTGNVNSSDVLLTPVVIKTEIMSEDEELSNASRSEDNGDGDNSSQNSRSSDLRVTTKVLPQTNTLGLKNVVNQIKPVGGKPDAKKQRARKSFPNKSNFNAIATPSNTSLVSVKRPTVPQPLLAQNNGMVYIPVDPKISAGPIQNLTSAPTSSPSATPKAPVNLISTSSLTSNVNMSNSNYLVDSSNTTITSSLPSTILTTSLQLPLVYSAIPIPTINGPATINNQLNPATLQLTCSVPPSNTPVASEQHMLSGFVTPTLASAITDAIVKGGPPKLVSKPAGPLRSEGDIIFPSEAGPTSKMLMENAHKMTDFFRSVIEETLGDLSKCQNLDAKVRLLELELEKVRYTHEKEIAELKHNTDMMLCEMRKSLENEKARLVAETRKQCELERIRAVEEAKTKQWCAACGKEAQFYCCWNTSYCDYPCQQKHWARHMASCAQKDNADANAQRVGVKVSPYNLKDKQTKLKDTAAPKSIPNTFMRSQFPTAVSRSSVPTIKRLIPITTQSTPRYTFINSNEGSWNLVTTPPQFSRVFPTSGLIMSDSSNKPLPGSPVNMLRNPKM